MRGLKGPAKMMLLMFYRQIVWVSWDRANMWPSNVALIPSIHTHLLPMGRRYQSISWKRWWYRRRLGCTLVGPVVRCVPGPFRRRCIALPVDWCRRYEEDETKVDQLGKAISFREGILPPPGICHLIFFESNTSLSHTPMLECSFLSRYCPTSRMRLEVRHSKTAKIELTCRKDGKMLSKNTPLLSPLMPRTSDMFCSESGRNYGECFMRELTRGVQWWSLPLKYGSQSPCSQNILYSGPPASLVQLSIGMSFSRRLPRTHMLEEVRCVVRNSGERILFLTISNCYENICNFQHHHQWHHRS